MMAVTDRSFVGLMILVGCFLLILDIQVVLTEETTPATPDDPSQCARELLDWCAKKDFSSAGISISIYTISNGGTHYVMTCITSGSNGTECKKNNEPWFHCFPDKTMTFKNEPLTEKTTDPDVCKAKNGYFGATQKAQANQAGFDKGMGHFGETMDTFHKSMSKIFHKGFPFRNDHGDHADDKHGNDFGKSDEKGPVPEEHGETEIDGGS